MKSVQCAKIKNEFSVSQKQAMIKLIEKKDKDKRFIKNWRPISLLNVDVKIVSKALASRLKEILPSLVSSEQTAYVKNRIISESGRLISDIIDICDKQNINGYLVTMDIEKAFDSLDHTFLINVLSKFGFGNNYISWIKTLLHNQESCVINAGNTTNYFKLEKGARQGDPISAYLFILAIEVLFLLIKNNNNIKGLSIFEHVYLYTAYADDSTFFLENSDSIKQLVETFKLFGTYSGLTPNFTKCEIAGIGSKKGVKVAVCGMNCIDLTKNTLKILGIHFSYNKKLKSENNFLKTITKIEQVLKLWRKRNLSLEGKITIFKTLAIPKIVYLAMMNPVPKDICDEIQKIQKDFIWNYTTPKVKHNTLINNFDKGGLKCIDIESKITSLQCSWIKKLYNNNFHEWKLIPLYLIKKHLGENFKFHPNLSLDANLINFFPLFYKNIFIFWQKFLVNFSKLPSCILSEFLWFNKFIKINYKPCYFECFSTKNLNFVNQLFCEAGKLKEWHLLKNEFSLNDKLYYKWIQIIDAIPSEWKNIIKENKNPTNNLILQDHHLIKNNSMISIEKLTSNELYSFLINLKSVIPTSQKYYNNLFSSSSLDWKDIYLLPRIITPDSYTRCFQYKILNNFLYLNKRLFLFGKHSTPLCSFCNLEDETVQHIFCDCPWAKSQWNSLKSFFGKNLPLHDLLPQTAILGFTDFEKVNNTIENHLLLLFKINIYKSRSAGMLCFRSLLKDIARTNRIEKTLCQNIQSKTKRYKLKWNKIENKLLA